MTIKIQLFIKDKLVWYGDTRYRVVNVLVRKFRLYVYLDGITNPIAAEKLYTEPTELMIKSQR